MFEDERLNAANWPVGIVIIQFWPAIRQKQTESVRGTLQEVGTQFMRQTRGTLFMMGGRRGQEVKAKTA